MMLLNFRFADFKKEEILQVKGSTPIVRNKAGLESLARI
jgi:hypothetical protein